MGKVNSALKSWITFVKKVQKEENITYPEAMKRAKVRKSEWKRGGATDDNETADEQDTSSSSPMTGTESTSSSSPMTMTMMGGKKRGKKSKKTKKSKKSKKSRKTRKTRKTRSRK